MNTQFPTNETFLNYLRGRLEGLACTARMDMPEEVQADLEKIIGVIIQYSDGNKAPVE